MMNYLKEFVDWTRANCLTVLIVGLALPIVKDVPIVGDLLDSIDLL